jgi:hypothetical protein
MRRESTGAATELERTESRERQELGYLPARAPRRQPPNRHPSPLRRRTLDGASKEGTTPMAPPPPNPADFGLSPEAGVGGRGGWDFSGSSRVNGAQQRRRHCGHNTKDFSQAHHSPPTPKPASEPDRRGGRGQQEGGGLTFGIWREQRHPPTHGTHPPTPRRPHGPGRRSAAPATPPSARWTSPLRRRPPPQIQSPHRGSH